MPVFRGVGLVGWQTIIRFVRPIISVIALRQLGFRCQMDFKNVLLLLIAGLAIAIVMLAFASADYSKFGSGFVGSGGGCVGVIAIEGEIVSENSLLSNAVSPQQVTDALQEAESDGGIAAVLLEINSGGGSAVASKEIYDELREMKKPVVSYLREVAASGAYYVASGSDAIVANPNTITGSIGARATIINYEELFNKLGLRQENVKTGALKDIGEGSRNLTEEERNVLNALLNETFDNFRSDVEEGRKGRLDPALFQQALDARILSARQALKAGLVDEIGGRRQALLKAAQLANLSVQDASEIGECQLVERNALFDLLSAFSTSLGRNVAASLKSTASSAGVQYS